MKAGRRTTWLIAIAAVLVLAGALVWRAHLTADPVIVFKGFGERDGERVAMFVLENRSGRTVKYGRHVAINGAVRRVGLMLRWLDIDPRDPAMDFRGTREAEPGERHAFPLPLAIGNGEVLKAPFRVRVECFQTRPGVWAVPPLASVPERMKPPPRTRVWSEVVTP